MSNYDITINSVKCIDDKPKFSVSFSKKGSYGVTLKVASVEGDISMSGNTGTWTAKGAMNDTTEYAIQVVMSSGGQGHKSYTEPLLFHPVQDISAALAGREVPNGELDSVASDDADEPAGGVGAGD